MLIELKEVLRQEPNWVLEEFCYSVMSTLELTADMLSTWIGNRNQCYVPEIKLLVQIKNHSVYEDLLQDSGNAKLFNASSGWFFVISWKDAIFITWKWEEKLLFLTKWLWRCLLRNCSIVLKKEIIHLNKFWTSLRLLFSGQGCILGVTPLKIKNLLPDLRPWGTNLLCF